MLDFKDLTQLLVRFKEEEVVLRLLRLIPHASIKEGQCMITLSFLICKQVFPYILLEFLPSKKEVLDENPLQPMTA